MPIYIVIGNDLRDGHYHLHRAFARYRDAQNNVKELNNECTKNGIPRLYYMYIMVLEEG